MSSVGACECACYVCVHVRMSCVSELCVHEC